MNQLIPTFAGVLAGEQQSLVNARDLHSVLESGQEFTAWIKNRIEKYGFIEGDEFLINLSKTSGIFGGRSKTEYHLSVDMAKELCLVEANDKGRQARKYFIEMEKLARQEIPAYLRRAELPRPGQVEALQIERLKQAVLATNPQMADFVRYYNLGLKQTEIGKLIGKDRCSVQKIERKLAEYGLITRRQTSHPMSVKQLGVSGGV